MDVNDPSLRGNENVVVDVNLSVNLDVNETLRPRSAELPPWGSASLASGHVSRWTSTITRRRPYLLIASTAVLTSIRGAEIPFVSVIGRPDVLSAASS